MIHQRGMSTCTDGLPRAHRHLLVAKMALDIDIATLTITIPTREVRQRPLHLRVEVIRMPTHTPTMAKARRQPTLCLKVEGIHMLTVTQTHQLEAAQ